MADFADINSDEFNAGWLPAIPMDPNPPDMELVSGEQLGVPEIVFCAVLRGEVDRLRHKIALANAADPDAAQSPIE